MTYVLIPGAGGSSWHWHRLAAELRSRGAEVLTPDLPAADRAAGFPEYAEVVAAAVGDRTDAVLVAHSLGAFTAPLVCERIPVRLLVLVAPMVPRPGESAGDWWAATGHPGAPRDPGVRQVTNFHDLPDDEAAEANACWGPQSGAPFRAAYPLRAWPAVPTRVLLYRDDRLFPPDFQRRVTKDRLGVGCDETPGGHFAHLSHPVAVADRLVAYAGGAAKRS